MDQRGKQSPQTKTGEPRSPAQQYQFPALSPVAVEAGIPARRLNQAMRFLPDTLIRDVGKAGTYNQQGAFKIGIARFRNLNDLPVDAFNHNGGPFPVERIWQRKYGPKERGLYRQERITLVMGNAAEIGKSIV